jgi:sugar/nucleoside kinase (ribokinase family)
MVDVVCSELPRSGSRVHADVTIRAGGSAVNAALAAAAARGAATVYGRIGNDAAGDLVLAELAAHGIARHLPRDPQLPTGVAVAFSGPTVVATRGANSRFASAEVPEEIDADALFVSGFALFQSGSADAATLAIERFTGRWIGIDVASVSAPGARGARRRPSHRRSRHGHLRHGRRGASDDRCRRGGGRAESGRKFSIACVKLAEEGALAAAGGRLERRRAARVARHSPFGAGDAFAGALLVALARGNSVGDALERGCRAGADVANRSSDQPSAGDQALLRLRPVA